MTVNELLDAKSVKIPLSAPSKEEAIRLLVDSLAEGGNVSDKAAYLEAVLQREATGSTGIGFGVAIPHGKSPGVAKAGIAFAKLAQPLEWASLDGNPVQVVFMIAVPQEAAGNEHLKILIAISRKLIDEEFRGKLMAVANYDELAALLADI